MPPTAQIVVTWLRLGLREVAVLMCVARRAGNSKGYFHCGFHRVASEFGFLLWHFVN